MDGCTAYLDGDERVQGPYCRLERGEVRVLVRKDAELGGSNAQTDACSNVFLGGLEPRIALRLFEAMVSLLKQANK